MQIRKIEPSDLEACSKILEEAYSKYPYNEIFKDATALEYVNEKYEKCRENSFVAIDDKGAIIAFIFLSVSSWSEGTQAILEEVAVSPSLQGQGIGNQLISYAHDYLNSLGAKSVMLWAKNDERLLEFYQKLGYSVAKDFVVMSRHF